MRRTGCPRSRPTGVTTCSASAPNWRRRRRRSAGRSPRRVLRLVQVAAHRVELVLLEQARADLVALGGEEGEQHPAADQERVDRGSRCPITPSLSETFDPPSTTVYGCSGLLGEPVEHVEFGCDEQAGSARQQSRRARRRWPACGAPPRIRRRRRRRRGSASCSAKSSRSASSFAVSPALKRRFSRSGDVAVAEAVDGVRRGVAHGVARERDGSARAARESRWATGARLYLASGAPSGRPRWEMTITRAPWHGSGRSGSRSDARIAAVVGDRAVLERDVEVTTDDHRLACKRGRVKRGCERHAGGRS